MDNQLTRVMTDDEARKRHDKSIYDHLPLVSEYGLNMDFVKFYDEKTEKEQNQYKKHLIVCDMKKERREKERKKKITCECGSIITKGSLLKHHKTKKHCEFIEEIVIDDN